MRHNFGKRKKRKKTKQRFKVPETFFPHMKVKYICTHETIKHI